MTGALAVVVAAVAFATPPVSPEGDAILAATGDGAAYACRQDVHEHDRSYPGEYVHVASITQAPNGDLLYGFVGGADEHDPATKRTYMARMPVGESSWGPVEVPWDVPDRADGNAVLWHDGEGRVWGFASTIQGSGWSEADLSIRWSDDSGLTWSDPMTLRAELGWNVGTAPLRMSNGEVVLPVYDERFATSGFYVTADGWQTWRSYPGLPAGPELEPLGHAFAVTWPRGIQASTVELEPGHLLAYMRSGNDAIMETESFDYGRTWSTSTASQHPNPGARVALLELANGNLMLASNPVDGDAPERSPMTVALSEDGGETWPWSVEVETNRDERYQYPYLTQTPDGMIHLGYTHSRRTKNMRHVVFNEAFVRDGPDITSNPVSGRRAYEEGVRIPIERVEYDDGSFTPVERCSWVLEAGSGS